MAVGEVPCELNQQCPFTQLATRLPQQMRTPLGVGSLVLLHDQARPKSSAPYKLPDLSATVIDEPLAAMQPVASDTLDPRRYPTFDGY
jgi:hypothetical protein